MNQKKINFKLERCQGVDSPPLLENEKSYKHWRRAVLMWNQVTKIESKKRASAIVLSLSGKFKELALKINPDLLDKDDGLEILLVKLDDEFRKLKLETYAVYEELEKKRNNFQTMSDYISSLKRLSRDLSERGIAIPDEMMACIVLKGAKLSAADKKNVLEAADALSFNAVAQQLAKIATRSDKYQFKPASNEQRPQKILDVQQDYNEKAEDEKEENVFKFIKDRDSGKLFVKKQEVTQSVSAGDEVGTAAAEPEDQWVFGGGSHTFGSGNKIESASSFGDVASFANLATGVQRLGFKEDPSFQFPGAGQMLFQQPTTATETNDRQDPSLFKCDDQFKPVLAEPPPLIESKTGEEGEAVLFKERCKVYRYDTEAKAWKERGVGEIKILRNDEHALHRIVMRRDQIFNVCTNHVIAENTNPEAHLGSTKACSYFVMDYSESKIPTPERIAIRFKTDELCTEYMNKIYEIKLSGGLVW